VQTDSANDTVALSIIQAQLKIQETDSFDTKAFSDRPEDAAVAVFNLRTCDSERFGGRLSTQSSACNF
jgi:hypothetical protein